MEIVAGSFEDETLKAQDEKNVLTEEQLKDFTYCVLHRSKRHTTMDYWAIRKVFHKHMEEGKILLQNEMIAV